ncbi:arabinan endo-1,5-alpha-L-arabinosidase [Paenibacillus jamilae]|uniref:glycoside hydrolase family 43 protein n=1 Tax=Paenibacillus jamilae TaxID=114136 RepID=UPI0007AB72E3|nr:glycoside hydrolase family 43 protein [Paenibacillus jamilae]KZE73901.1 arabinan endo-1,5-alpha-L-arabinosidase [Paenibacillus jamilae]
MLKAWKKSVRGRFARTAFAAVTSAALLLSVVPSTSAEHWALTGDVAVHDPSITKEGNAWYIFSTGQGIQVQRSDDGHNFYRLPQIFLSPLPWWKSYVPKQTPNDVWAPDAQKYNGRVWVYYSISTFGSRTSAIGLTSATSIGAGSWRDDGLVLRTTDSDDYNAIDPNLVIDASGNPWLSFGSWNSGLKVTRLDKNTMKPTGQIYSIAKRTAGGLEAPHVTYRNGYYYLFASIDNCCKGVNSNYKIIYGRSTSITGPYVDKSGKSLMDGGGTILDAGNDRWRGPGGQSVYNNSVIARHAYDATDGGNPKLLISDLKWDSTGWPTY